MKKKVRSLIRSFIKTKVGWFLLKPLVYLGDYIEFQKNKSDYYADLQKKFEQYKILLQKPVVKSGPFMGLKYPGFESFGSTIFPKIIGSYELEIQSIISELIKEDFSTVLDIGSAEGYYAIGFALKLQITEIHAFDINKNANDFCKEMAVLNNVDDRVHIRSACTADTLLDFNYGNKSLVICDCEGFEKQLFTTENCRSLKNCFLLIEVHDFIDITISSYLVNLFSNSHTIKRIKSIDDIEKAYNYDFSVLNDLSLNDRFEILKESRPHIMEWFYLVPKYNKSLAI